LRRDDYQQHWCLMAVPGSIAAGSGGLLKDDEGPAWYRCVARIPASWKGERLSLTLAGGDQGEAWFNGKALPSRAATSERREYAIDPASVDPGDANLIVVLLANKGFSAAPSLSNGTDTLRLEGRWQFRIGDDKSWSNMPLPSKFGAGTDVVFELHAN
jgi:hypothetical protein